MHKRVTQVLDWLATNYLARRAEYLLPTLRQPVTLEEFPFITQRRENPQWTEAALRAKILELGSWEYYFAFSHGLTTELSATFNAESRALHRFRSQLISATVAQLLGDTLGQARVLDLACHCGVMTLDLAFRGAGSVVGVELREKNLRQAEFLKAYYRVDNATFRQGDVYALDADLTADVVMCLGILYHVVRPIELIEACYQRCQQFAVIDTICHKEPLPIYWVVGDKDPQSVVEGTRPTEMHPTYQGLIASMRQVGFREIVEVVGVCDQPVPLYPHLMRRCLIGFKTSDLRPYQHRRPWKPAP